MLSCVNLSWLVKKYQVKARHYILYFQLKKYYEPTKDVNPPVKTGALCVCTGRSGVPCRTFGNLCN